MPRTYVNYIVIIKSITKICYKEMKQQQTVIKTVKDANNQRRDSENNRWERNAKNYKIKTNEARKEQGEQKLQSKGES